MCCFCLTHPFQSYYTSVCANLLSIRVERFKSSKNKDEKDPIKDHSTTKAYSTSASVKSQFTFFMKVIVILKRLIILTKSLTVVETKDKLGIECVPHEYLLWPSIQMLK